MNIKKLKFYDKQFKILGFSYLFLTIIFLFFYNINSLILDILLIFFGGSFIVTSFVVSYGMVYHFSKRNDWSRFASWIFLGNPIFATFYYFFIMRSEFKNGNGNYKISSYNSSPSQYYLENIDKINKQDNIEFINFIKWIVLLILLILLFVIFKFYFF